MIVDKQELLIEDILSYALYRTGEVYIGQPKEVQYQICADTLNFSATVLMENK